MSFEIEVVIAAYNTAAYLGETLDSVLAQDLDVGVWVVDDGSTDATREVVEPYLHTGRVFYLHQANSGRPAIPRNLGLRRVRAPYVVFFDGDDVMAPGHLRAQRDLLQAHPAWIALTCDYRNFSAHGAHAQSQFLHCPKLQSAFQCHARESVAGEVLIELNPFEAKTILAEENFFINGSAIYRTASVQRIGGFDERLQASEDFDLFWRVAGLGPIGISTFLSFQRRLHATNISNDYARVLEAKRASRDRLKANETDPKLRRILSQTVARTLGDLATFHLPLDTHKGARFLAMAVVRGTQHGIVPAEAFKALLKCALKRHF